MSKYESVIITKPDENIAEEVSEKIATFIKDNATLTHFDSLGKRQLVYTCKGFDYGNYFIFYYESTKEFMFELERQFRLAEDIIKYMTIKRED